MVYISASELRVDRYSLQVNTRSLILPLLGAVVALGILSLALSSRGSTRVLWHNIGNLLTSYPWVRPAPLRVYPYLKEAPPLLPSPPLFRRSLLPALCPSC